MLWSPCFDLISCSDHLFPTPESLLNCLVLSGMGILSLSCCSLLNPSLIPVLKLVSAEYLLQCRLHLFPEAGKSSLTFSALDSWPAIHLPTYCFPFFLKAQLSSSLDYDLNLCPTSSCPSTRLSMVTSNKEISDFYPLSQYGDI